MNKNVSFKSGSSTQKKVFRVEDSLQNA